MGSLSTLNALTENRSVNFNSLHDIANGKYNMGEVVAKKGALGGIVFDKINNHVSRTEKNNVVSTVEQNRTTNAAVFKAILEHYGKDQKDLVETVKLMNLGNRESIGELLKGFKNTYIKTAFEFLMTDGAEDRPLSRDEVKLLLHMLNDQKQAISEASSADEKPKLPTPAGVKRRLEDLRWFKRYSAHDDGAYVWASEHPSFRDAGDAMLGVLTAASKNQRWHTGRLNKEDEAEMAADQAAQARYDAIKNTQSIDQNPLFFAGEEALEWDEAKEKATRKTVDKEQKRINFSEQAIEDFAEKVDFQSAAKQVNRIAANAFESSEDLAGGEGFMGIIDGKVVKYLTHSEERKNIGVGLTEEQKAAINKSTAELRAQLVELAGKPGFRALKAEIENLLAPKQADIDAHNGLDLLSRQTIAQAVTRLGQAFRGLCDRKNVKVANAIPHTSFAAVLARGGRTEEELQALKEISLAQTASVPKYQAFIELLMDPDRVKAAAAEVDAALKACGRDTPITLCQGVDDVNAQRPAANMRDQFKGSDKYTGPTQREIQSQGTRAEETCMMVFADGNFFGGGIGKNYHSQEEATLTDELDPRVAAWMLEKGMIKLSNYNNTLGFEYVNLSTVNGGYILTDPFSGKNFAFHSMPSLDIPRSYNHDILGNANWACMSKLAATGQTATPQMHANAIKFFDKFYHVIGNGSQFPVKSKRALEDLMEYLIFANDDEHCNVFASDNDEEVIRAVTAYVEFAAKQLAKDPAAFRKRAREGYEAAVTASLARLYRTAQKMGVKKFIGGAAGTGEFRNDPSAVAKCTSTAFKTEGGEMDYIMPKSEFTQVFKTAFANA